MYSDFLPHCTTVTRDIFSSQPSEDTRVSLVCSRSHRNAIHAISSSVSGKLCEITSAALIIMYAVPHHLATITTRRDPEYELLKYQGVAFGQDITTCFILLLTHKVSTFISHRYNKSLKKFHATISPWVVPLMTSAKSFILFCSHYLWFTGNVCICGMPHRIRRRSKLQPSRQVRPSPVLLFSSVRPHDVGRALRSQEGHSRAYIILYLLPSIRPK